MREILKLVIIFTILAILIGGLAFFIQKGRKKGLPLSEESLSKNMKLTSPAFGNNQFIPSKYTCDGQDINPPLQISGVPEEAKSLVLIVDDPDAPGGTWDHWIVWNINPSISEIKENEVPEGAIEGLNDFEKHSYGGPCPPSGVHHYHFRLYALSKKLDLDPSSRKEDVKKAMEGFILDQTELVGLYQRK